MNRESHAARLYRLLLHLYPRWHRIEWSEELTDFFRDQYREAARDHGWSGTLVAWYRAGVDTIVSAIAVRLGLDPGGPPHSKHNAPNRRNVAADHVRQLIKQSLRELRRSPAFTLSVLLTLGLGIGANAVMFGIVDRLLLRPPAHVRDAGDVRRVLARRMFITRQVTSPAGAYPDYKDFDAAESFVATAAYTGTRERTLGRGINAVRVRTVYTTGSLFALLGVRPALGRFFTASEDRRGEPPRAVLDYGFWQRQFGSDPNVLGQLLQLGEQEYIVVGVAPKGFTGAELDPVDVWVNLFSRPGRWDETRDWFFVTPIVRMRPGVDLNIAEAEATLLHRQGRAGDPYYDQRASIVLAPLMAARGPIASNESVVARWLTGVAVVVLLIACANVANLLLARGIERRRETAVRLALGASRHRLVGHFLTESVLLATFGGLAGVVFAYLGGDVIRKTLASGVAWVTSPVNGRVLLFSALATVVTGLLAGLLPAIQSSKSDVSQALKSGEHGSRSRSKTRITLLLVQGALSVVLLIGAGLFVRSLMRVESLDLGFEPDGVLAATIEFDRGRLGDSSAALQRQLDDVAVEQLAAVPGVEFAASTSSLPFYSRLGVELEIPGIDSIPSLSTGGPYVSSVSADYFDVLRMTFLRGRAFTDSDNVEGADPVAVINQKMADLLWPNDDPLTKCMYVGQDPNGCSRIVGVVRDMREGGLNDDDIAMLYFVPNASGAVRSQGNLMLRVPAGHEERFSRIVRREIEALHPSIRFVQVRSLHDLIAPRTRSWHLGAILFTVFGGLALLIAVVGLYSLLAFDVAQRLHELGIRAALGAERRHLMALVLKQAAMFLAGGLALGVAISMAAGKAIEPLLFRISSTDPTVFVAVIGTLAATGMLGAMVAARRAVAADPIEALRAE